MPELPEVETVKRGLQPVMEGATIERLETRRADLRFPFPENFNSRVDGARVLGLSRRAKYLLAELDTNETLIMHLGMSGSFRIEVDAESRFPGVFHHDRSKNPAHDHVVFHLTSGLGKARVYYNDPRRFGFMDIVPTGKLYQCKHFVGMGIEPTGNSLNEETIDQLFAGKNSPLKAALLNQKLIAGLGNIYVCEALWRAQLSPERKALTLCGNTARKREQRKALADAISQVINAAIEAGGSSLRDHRQADGTLGYFQHSFAVYDQEGAACPRSATGTSKCSGTIKRITQSGRSTFFCPKCQR